MGFRRFEFVLCPSEKRPLRRLEWAQERRPGIFAFTPILRLMDTHEVVISAFYRITVYDDWFSFRALLASKNLTSITDRNYSTLAGCKIGLYRQQITPYYHEGRGELRMVPKPINIGNLRK